MDVSKIKPVQGIYKLVCSKNRRIYIGQSVDIRCRALEHKRHLIRGDHWNQIVQNSFNKYGIESFKLSLVEKIKDREQLTERERYWMDFYDTLDLKKGFNICPAEVNQANKKGNKKHAEKVMGEKNGKVKLSDVSVIEICKLLNKKKRLSFTEIGKMYNVSCNAISSINSGRTRGYISKKYLNKKIIDTWSEENKEKWL